MARSAQYLAVALCALALLVGCQGPPKDRLWVESSVNGQPVRLFVDTGATMSMLERPAVDKLQLPVTNPPARPNQPPGVLNFGLTSPVDFSVWGATSRTRFGANDSPKYIKVEADGVIGWAELRGKILRIDATAQQVQRLDQLPDDLAGWTRLRVVPTRQMLVLEVPPVKAQTPPGLILIDTGNTFGVGLSVENWKAWRAAHPNAQETMHIYYTPSSGVVTSAQAWASQITIGPLELTETPVEESDPVTARLGGAQHLATLGMAALRRLDFIFDGRQSVVYLRPRHTPPEPFTHNRFGAVFLPVDSVRDELIAQVAKDTPAYEAGLRNGDIVTGINRQYAVNWLRHPDTGMPDFEWDAGSKLQIQVLKPDGHYLIFARMRDLIGPGSAGYVPVEGGH